MHIYYIYNRIIKGYLDISKESYVHICHISLPPLSPCSWDPPTSAFFTTCADPRVSSTMLFPGAPASVPNYRELKDHWGPQFSASNFFATNFRK